MCSAIIVGSAESFWRIRGHKPFVVDSPAFWSYHRSRIYSGGKKHAVLLGTSRIQLGFSTECFHREFPAYEMTQLAIHGKHPVASLLDISADERFKGTVICAVISEGLQESSWDRQTEYVDYYHNQSNTLSNLESLLAMLVNSQFVVTSSTLKCDNLAHCLVFRGELPIPSHISTNFDRSRLADFSLLDNVDHRGNRISRTNQSRDSPVASPNEWLESFKTIEKAITKIHDRGGKVVLVRFPTDDEHWELDELKYPRANYWDRMAAVNSAETIHFADFPELSRFDLPDTSHLDYRDAPAFTSALLEILEERGILTRAE